MSYFRKLVIAAGLAIATSASAGEAKIVTDVGASADWIAKALSSSGYKADFSIDSLKEIDRFFEDHAPKGKPKPNGLLSEDLGARLFSIGSYVGEVIRRKTGGKWQGNDRDPQAEVNVELKLTNGPPRRFN